MKDRPPIVALLGPTNTGKTFRAIERMLEFDSGMMGFPLRLLAREVYDKLSTRVGESQVALVTGEEKRIPPRARYWIATVEAMPLDREVDFVAIDEVQLAAHRERGHVFTDRLLRARGREETWFLGADTMRDAVETLFPDVEVRSSPRLSTLGWTGTRPLSQVQKRSALVAFSIPRVFALGEMIRERKGGAAVVLGALSPRARNAQVAMFQSREVDYLVATDAIGMGLNLDLEHVAFASLQKFDGREARPLDLAEIGQIAGRAGRHTQNGTFGIVAPLGAAFASGSSDGPHLSARAANALERHRFPRVESLRWRNAELDLSNLSALLASLEAPPPNPILRRTDGAEDHAVLRAFAARDDIVRLSRANGATALLYDVACVPDYRKILFEDHVDTLADIYRRLMARGGKLEVAFVEEKLDAIGSRTAEVEDLLARLAASRIWNYVAQQGWVERAADVSERAMSVEDALSDTLHRALCDRFVARGKRWVGARTPVPDGPFAQLRHLLTAPGEPEQSLAEKVASAPHEALSVDAAGSIWLGGNLVGRLARTKDLRAPDAKLVVQASPAEKLRAERRLVAFTRDLVREVSADLLPDEARLTAAGRGLYYVLASGLTSALVEEVAAQLGLLSEADERLYRDAGVVFGKLAVYHPRGLKPDAVQRRAALVGALEPGIGSMPTGREISVRARRGVASARYLSLGYPLVGDRAVRADVLERVAKRLAECPPDERPKLPIGEWLGVPRREAHPLLVDLERMAGAGADTVG